MVVMVVMDQRSVTKYQTRKNDLLVIGQNYRRENHEMEWETNSVRWVHRGTVWSEKKLNTQP